MAFSAELFVAVLGASSYIYAEATRSQELLHWVNAHVHAFEYIGGCPAIVVCDNLRSGVTRPHRYEPDVNATYAEMAAHYGVAIIPARTYKPRDKAKAESGVLLAERWIIARLRNERFTQPGRGQRRDSAPASSGSTPGPSRSSTARARASSRTSTARPCARCPPSRYEFATWRRAKVNIDYHVERADRHYYSVPYRWSARSSTSALLGCHRRGLLPARRVASHVRSYRPGYSTDPAHMPESHRRHAALDAGAHHRLGRAHRARHRHAGRGHHGGPAPSRAGLSLLSRHHPPGRQIRHRSRWRPPAAGRWRCALSPTARSSRSCALASTSSRCPTTHPRAPTRATTTCAARTTTTEREESMHAHQPRPSTASTP